MFVLKMVSKFLDNLIAMMAMTKQQLLTVITFVVVNFCNAMCVSMQVLMHCKPV
jgi:hypothetical protein